MGLDIPAENEIEGPWLLGVKELEELNDIIESIDRKLIESEQKGIEKTATLLVRNGEYKTIEEALKDSYKCIPSKPIIKISLISKDNSKLNGTSVLQLIKDANIETITPVELWIYIKHDYSNNFEMRISRSYEDRLKYSAECFDKNSQNEIKYLMDNWINYKRPNKAICLWNNSYFHFFTIFIFFWALLISSLLIISTDSPTTIGTYRNIADSLINDGITESNHYEAIELLLRYNSNYIPNDAKEVTTLNYLALRISCVFLFLIIVLIIRPRTTLGVGKYKRRLIFYKKYFKIIFVIIPSIILFPLLYDLIKYLFGLK